MSDILRCIKAEELGLTEAEAHPDKFMRLQPLELDPTHTYIDGM